MRIGKYYPLHLHKSLNYISKIMPFISLIVLLIDSRVPSLKEIYFSELKKKWPQKNILSIFTKSDLVERGDNPNSFNLFKPSSRHKIIKLIKNTLGEINLTPQENTNSIVVMGGVNSGKSSFINLLVNQKKVKRSSEPGTTRTISRHKVPNTNLLLYDSPGFFPTNPSRELSYLLQLLNFVPNSLENATNFTEWGYNYLFQKHYKKLEKFFLNKDNPPENYYLFLHDLSSKYRFIEKEGNLSLQKAETKFIQLIRKGEIGKIVWELKTS